MCGLKILMMVPGREGAEPSLYVNDETHHRRLEDLKRCDQLPAVSGLLFVAGYSSNTVNTSTVILFCLATHVGIAQ